MKLKLDRFSEVNISYSHLSNNLIIDICLSDAVGFLEQIIDEVGTTPLSHILTVEQAEHLLKLIEENDV